MARQGEGPESGLESPPLRPLLLLMKGHPGSGKSTLAHAIASKSSLGCLVDKDDIRDALLPLERKLLRQEVELRMPLHSELNSLSYQGMWNVAGRQLSVGLSVVVDCPLARRELLNEGLELARQHGAHVAVLECTVSDEDEWRRRVEHRAEAGIYAALLQSRASSDGLANSGEGSSAEGSSGDGSSRSGIGRSEELVGLWHKPASWADIQQLLVRYDGCWLYDTAPVPKLVVDTAKHVRECYTAQALEWIQRGAPVEKQQFECICPRC